MVRYTGDADFERRLGNHLAGYEAAGAFVQAEGYPAGYVRDGFGVIWNRSGADKDIGVIVGAVIPDLEALDYTLPPVDEPGIRAGVERMLAEAEDRFTVAGIGFSLFERAWTLCTMPELLMAMVAAPEAVEELLDRICDYNLKILDILCDYPVDCIRFGDDWGQQKGRIMGPAHWRRFLKPRLKRMYGRVKAAGKFVMQHSCGDIREVLDDVIEIGLDCYETFQPEIYGYEAFAASYGDRLSIYGGVSTQQCLPCCTPDEVRRQTAALLRTVGRDGGLIAGPTHAIPGDVPCENVLAMYEVLRHQDKYV